MKNIQIIDNAINCVYDIFNCTEEEFNVIFPKDTDIAFIDEVIERENSEVVDKIFSEIWKRRVCKKDAMGIHGILFYEHEEKKKYYPNRTDEGACNPDGSKLRD